MTALLLTPVYLLINFYILRWILRWMGACTKHFKKKWIRIILISIYAFIAASPVLAFLIHEDALRRPLKQLSNVYFGTFLYILLTVVVVDFIRIILKKTKWISPKLLSSRKTFVTTGACCGVLILMVTVYGLMHSTRVYTTSYDVAIEKEIPGKQELKIALVSDLHLGYSIGDAQMKRMVEKVNAMKPDIICIAGDIFDNEYESIEDPEQIIKTLNTLKSTYGVYACWGNHDIDEPILAGFTFGTTKEKATDTRMENFLKAANVILLNDEVRLIDDSFYLIGRKDYSRAKKVENERLTPKELTENLDLNKPVLVIDHQPKDLQELADSGVDLDLCGHTHDGQVFPGNLTINLFWENAYGLLQKDKMTNIVTSGVGIWGPNMRVGTKSEVVEITLQLK